MQLRSYIFKRLLLSIFVLVGLSVVIFVISRVVPGDPARIALGPRAPQFAVDALRQEMHLDKPLVTQYVYWVKGVAVWDLGESLTTRRPVTEDVKEFLPATLELALVSAFLVVTLSIFFGTLAARYRDKWIDTLVPQVLPPPTITGLVTVDSLLSGNLTAFWDALKHLIVPAFALAMGPMFQEARIVRTAMTDNMGKDYLAAAKGYGIPNRVIMTKYLLKPSLIPAVSVMGLDIASLMSNAFLVEVVFNWPGISRYGMNAMLRKDLNSISAVIIIFGLIFVIVNILVDFVVAYLDPRIRLGGKV